MKQLNQLVDETMEFAKQTEDRLKRQSSDRGTRHGFSLFSLEALAIAVVVVAIVGAVVVRSQETPITFQPCLDIVWVVDVSPVQPSTWHQTFSSSFDAVVAEAAQHGIPLRSAIVPVASGVQADTITPFSSDPLVLSRAVQALPTLLLTAADKPTSLKRLFNGLIAAISLTSSSPQACAVSDSPFVGLSGRTAQLVVLVSASHFSKSSMSDETFDSLSHEILTSINTETTSVAVFLDVSDVTSPSIEGRLGASRFSQTYRDGSHFNKAFSLKAIITDAGRARSSLQAHLLAKGVAFRVWPHSALSSAAHNLIDLAGPFWPSGPLPLHASMSQPGSTRESLPLFICRVMLVAAATFFNFVEQAAVEGRWSWKLVKQHVTEKVRRFWFIPADANHVIPVCHANQRLCGRHYRRLRTRAAQEHCCINMAGTRQMVVRLSG